MFVYAFGYNAQKTQFLFYFAQNLFFRKYQNIVRVMRVMMVISGRENLWRVRSRRGVMVISEITINRLDCFFGFWVVVL